MRRIKWFYCGISMALLANKTDDGVELLLIDCYNGVDGFSGSVFASTVLEWHV